MKTDKTSMRTKLVIPSRSSVAIIVKTESMNGESPRTVFERHQAEIEIMIARNDALNADSLDDLCLALNEMENGRRMYSHNVGDDVGLDKWFDLAAVSLVDSAGRRRIEYVHRDKGGSAWEIVTQEQERARICPARRASPGGLPCSLPDGHDGEHKHITHDGFEYGWGS